MTPFTASRRVRLSPPFAGWLSRETLTTDVIVSSFVPAAPMLSCRMSRSVGFLRPERPSDML